MKKKGLILLAFTLIAGFFLLKPLAEEEKKIDSKPERLAAKLKYLKNISIPDSVKKPNLIIIMADDLGKMDVSTYGGTTMQTPEIDKLASEGCLFTEGYVTNPICSPSRAGMLTGRNQSRFGYENNIHERYPRNVLEHFVFKHFLATDSWQVADMRPVPSEEEMEKQGIPAEEVLLSEVLHNVGYRTGVLGKWHLGYNETSIPINRGFDYQYGFYEAYSLYKNDLEAEDIVNQKCDDFSDPFLWEKARTGTCAIRKNDMEYDEEGYLTDRIQQEAEAFIETNKDTSFFLYVSFNAPHTPFQAQKKYYDMYSHIEDPYKRIYYAMIKNLDDAIGGINSKVEELGIAENTIIVFLSDNGGATYTKATDNAPLKGGKMTHFEGGLNVPFSIKWKGVVPEQGQYDNPVVSTDIYSTMLNLLNIPLMEDRTYDGIDLMPFVSGQSNERAHEVICWRSDFLRSVRKGDWKLIEDRLGGESVLYNLKENNLEQINLYAENPEVVDDLISELDKWESECEDARWPRVMNFKFSDKEKNFYFPL